MHATIKENQYVSWTGCYNCYRVTTSHGRRRPWSMANNRVKPDKHVVQYTYLIVTRIQNAMTNSGWKLPSIEQQCNVVERECQASLFSLCDKGKPSNTVVTHTIAPRNVTSSW